MRDRASFFRRIFCWVSYAFHLLYFATLVLAASRLCFPGYTLCHRAAAFPNHSISMMLGSEILRRKLFLPRGQPGLGLCTSEHGSVGSCTRAILHAFLLSCGPGLATLCWLGWSGSPAVHMATLKMHMHLIFNTVFCLAAPVVVAHLSEWLCFVVAYLLRRLVVEIDDFMLHPPRRCGASGSDRSGRGWFWSIPGTHLMFAPILLLSTSCMFFARDSGRSKGKGRGSRPGRSGDDGQQRQQSEQHDGDSGDDEAGVDELQQQGNEGQGGVHVHGEDLEFALNPRAAMVDAILRGAGKDARRLGEVGDRRQDRSFRARDRRKRSRSVSPNSSMHESHSSTSSESDSDSSSDHDVKRKFHRKLPCMDLSLFKPESVFKVWASHVSAIYRFLFSELKRGGGRRGGRHSRDRRLRRAMKGCVDLSKGLLVGDSRGTEAAAHIARGQNFLSNQELRLLNSFEGQNKVHTQPSNRNQQLPTSSRGRNTGNHLFFPPFSSPNYPNFLKTPFTPLTGNFNVGHAFPNPMFSQHAAFVPPPPSAPLLPLPPHSNPFATTKPGTCRICGQPGHWGRECPNKAP